MFLVMHLSSGYDIYVVLHVAYGRTYVEVAYNDGLLLSRGASGEALLGGVVVPIEEGNVGMPWYHRVAYSSQHQCQIVLFSCFNYLSIYILSFFNIKQTQKNIVVSSVALIG